MFQNIVYQFRALPFGLTTAPLVFTRVVAFVGRILRLKGVRVLLYLDDWLILAPSHATVLRARSILL